MRKEDKIEEEKKKERRKGKKKEKRRVKMKGRFICNSHSPFGQSEFDKYFVRKFPCSLPPRTKRLATCLPASCIWPIMPCYYDNGAKIVKLFFSCSLFFKLAVAYTKGAPLPVSPGIAPSQGN